MMEKITTLEKGGLTIYLLIAYNLDYSYAADHQPYLLYSHKRNGPWTSFAANAFEDARLERERKIAQGEVGSGTPGHKTRAPYIRPSCLLTSPTIIINLPQTNN